MIIVLKDIDSSQKEVIEKIIPLDQREDMAFIDTHIFFNDKNRSCLLGVKTDFSDILKIKGLKVEKSYV